MITWTLGLLTARHVGLRLSFGASCHFMAYFGLFVLCRLLNTFLGRIPSHCPASHIVLDAPYQHTCKITRDETQASKSFKLHEVN